MGDLLSGNLSKIIMVALAILDQPHILGSVIEKAHERALDTGAIVNNVVPS